MYKNIYKIERQPGGCEKRLEVGAGIGKRRDEERGKGSRKGRQRATTYRRKKRD